MGADQLSGRVAIVTGASSGIGAATARALAALGASLVVVARRSDELHALAASLPGPSLAVVADVSREHDAARIATEALEAFGRIDILVNNAGTASFAPILETSLDDWQRMLDVNLTGSFLCARAVLPAMLAAGSGRIVNVCSDVSRRVFPGGGAYCASKFGQYAFSQTLAKEVRERGIAVGAVLPGMVQSEFAGGKPEERNDWILQPGDVAEAISFMVTRPDHAVVDELQVHPVVQEI
ncbi:MAG: hypothetical protein JWN72_795 [Thermoleophilia bacterium]|nr:hypothetical protein [Thermoleophilia bacterium]